MLSVDELRQIFPDCEGRSDEEILRAYHAKFYGQTDFDRFLKQYAASIRARGGRTAARSGASREKSQKGPDAKRQLYDRNGYGIDKTSGNPYPYLRDEKGKFALDEKGERMLDYDAGVPSDEILAELELKANGQGLQLQQAAPPTPLDAEVERATAEAGNYEGEYLNEAIMRGLPGAAELAWQREPRGSGMGAPMEWQDYAPEMNAMEAQFLADVGNRDMRGPASPQDQKRAALQATMRQQELAPEIDAAYQNGLADLENHGYRLRKGFQGAIRNNIWGDPTENDAAINVAREKKKFMGQRTAPLPSRFAIPPDSDEDWSWR